MLSDGEPIRGVNFVLYSSTVRANDVTNCNRDKVPGMPAEGARGALCYVVSGQDGVFAFPSLPYGDYGLVSGYVDINVLNILCDNLGVTEALCDSALCVVPILYLHKITHVKLILSLFKVT